MTEDCGGLYIFYIVIQMKISQKTGMDMNFTYIVKCSDGTLYTGWTNDLDRRMKAHNDGKGAKYTKSRRPVVLAYFECFETKEEAMRREYEIKRLTRKEKMKLIRTDSVG